MHYSVSDIILGIVQNSIEAVGGCAAKAVGGCAAKAVGGNAAKAGAGLVILDYIETRAPGAESVLRVCVSDNGCGMGPEALHRAMDPFSSDGAKHPNRKVGLGLPFLKQACEAVGGRMDVKSAEGNGTSVFFEMDLGHIDTPPAGDLAGLFTQCLLFRGEYEISINRTLNWKKYTVTRREIKDAVGDLHDAEAIFLIKKYIDGLEEELMGGGTRGRS